MMTQTHILLSAAVFAKPGRNRRNAVILIGSFIPDLVIYILFAWASLNGISQDQLWNHVYWREPWQSWNAIGNSVPMYLALLLVAVALIHPSDGRPRWQSLPALFALSALLHIAFDLPLHNDDAHQHVWPVTDWRFISPLSYWDRDHYGGIIAPLEAILGMGLAVLLFRRFKHIAVRVVLSIMLLLYLAVPVFFLLQLA